MDLARDGDRDDGGQVVPPGPLQSGGGRTVSAQPVAGRAEEVRDEGGGGRGGRTVGLPSRGDKAGAGWGTSSVGSESSAKVAHDAELLPLGGHQSSPQGGLPSRGRVEGTGGGGGVDDGDVDHGGGAGVREVADAKIRTVVSRGRWGRGAGGVEVLEARGRGTEAGGTSEAGEAVDEGLMAAESGTAGDAGEGVVAVDVQAPATAAESGATQGGKRGAEAELEGGPEQRGRKVQGGSTNINGTWG